jgi:hypothetical protein
VTDVRSKEITNPERIRRIIGILRLDGREIEVHIPYYIEVAKIADTTQDVFVVKITDSFIDLQDEELEAVYINFVFSGVELFGRCPIQGRSESSLTLEYPNTLESRSKRRYPRIKLGRHLSAKLTYKQYPEKKLGEVSSKDIPVKYSKLYWEVQRESVDIKKVFVLVGAEIKKISPHAEINLFNKEVLGTRDVQILRKSGKVLYVDDCRKIQSYTRIIPSDKIVSYSYYVSELRIAGRSKEKVVAELKAIVREHLSKGYSSKVLVPIFSKEEVIGAVRAVKKTKDERLTFEDVSDLMSLSALLTMGIEKANFIPDLGDAVQSSLVNIGEGGIFLTIDNSGDETKLNEGTNIEVKFGLKEHEVTLKGKVLRKGEQAKSYAVEFHNLEEADRKFLKKFVEENIEGPQVSKEVCRREY